MESISPGETGLNRGSLNAALMAASTTASASGFSG